MIKGLEHLSKKDRLRQFCQFSLGAWEEKSQEDLINVYKYLMREETQWSQNALSMDLQKNKKQ